MKAAVTLRARLGIAVGFLEAQWDRLPHEAKYGDGAVDAMYDEFVRTMLWPVDTLDAVHMIAVRWLNASTGSPDVILLAFVLIVDGLLGPFVGSADSRILTGNVPTGRGDAVHLWLGPRGIGAVLAGIKTPPRQTQIEDYEPRLTDLLSFLRHAITRREHRPFEVIALPGELWKDFQDIDRSERGITPARVGLFSLRGDFAPTLTYTRTSRASRTARRYLFRAGAVSPTKSYQNQIAEVVRRASDPQTGVHILVLPEFMMSIEGEEALRLALTDVAEDPALEPPLLTVAGSTHKPTPSNDGTNGNCSSVFDRTGRVLWRQWKKVPFGARGRASDLREVVGSLPDDAAGEIAIREDIAAYGPYTICRTPLGSVAVAICSDVVPVHGSAPIVALGAASIDIVIVPAFTPSTQQFLAAAQALNRSRTTVLFANAYAATQFRNRPPVAAAWEETPSRFSPAGDEPVFAAFVSTPWASPIVMWFGAAVLADDNATFGVAIRREHYFDGLVCDLGSLLRAVVDA